MYNITVDLVRDDIIDFVKDHASLVFLSSDIGKIVVTVIQIIN